MPAAGAQQSDAAFDDFVATLREMQQQVRELAPDDPVQQAEGLRHIIRLVEMQNASFTDDRDPANPHVTRCPGGICKLGMDNPDFTYLTVGPITADHEYRIFGDRGTVPYITMQVFNGPIGGDVVLTSEDLVVDDDGTYEIILSAERPEGADNWMELLPDARRFVMRQAYDDWNDDVEASVQVDVVGGPDPSPVANVTDEDFASDLTRLTNLLGILIDTFQASKAEWPINDMSDPEVGAFGIEGAGFPTTVGSVGQYTLDEDEAMIIETPDPDVVHGGIQLGNVWLESLDYQSRQTSLNWHQSVADSDGVFRYVLAHTDPGTANWLDVSGHPDGALFMRWQDPSEDEQPAQPSVTVVPLADVDSTLPDDHPRVTPEERTEALRLRHLAVNQRRNPANLVPADAPVEAAGPADGSAGSDDDSVAGWAIALIAVGLVAAGGLGWVAGRRGTGDSGDSRA
jgi:hypothetical protein